MCLYQSDGRHKVYRGPGERYLQWAFTETASYGGGSVTFWADIRLESRIEQFLVKGGVHAKA